MSAKRFPISEGKREELSRQGVFAKSIELGTFALCLSLALSVFLFFSLSELSLEQLFEDWKSVLITENSTNTLLETLYSLFWSYYLFFMAIILLPMIVCFTLFELFQTKFKLIKGVFFQSPIRGFSVEKNFNYFASFRTLSLFLVLAGLIFIIAASGVSYLEDFNFDESLELSSEEMSKDITAEDSVFDDYTSTNILEITKEMFSLKLFSLWQIITIFSLFIAIFYKFLAIINFDKTYMMTREEVDKEAKESEPSSEMRSALRERH